MYGLVDGRVGEVLFIRSVDLLNLRGIGLGGFAFDFVGQKLFGGLVFGLGGQRDKLIADQFVESGAEDFVALLF